MKVSATTAQTQGRAQTTTNTRQLWNWYAEPMLKLQPVKTAAHSQPQSGQIEKSDTEAEEALLDDRYLRAGGSWTHFRNSWTLSPSDQR